ncbi:MAG: hypothetical protein HQM03_18675 [Magnetococcales bacterium]|nr:hypothetical protein [Magnetococcales bacterium]
MIRFLIFAAILAIIVWWIAQRRGMRVTLTPLGRNALLLAARHLLRLLLRRIGL